MGVIKPDPAIYAAVEAATGLPPEALLFTDDKPENIACRRRPRLADASLHRLGSAWAAHLVRTGLLSPKGGRAMTLQIIGPEAEAHLTWAGLSAGVRGRPPPAQAPTSRTC